MNIRNTEIETEQYVVISYSHADTEAVAAELAAYDKRGVCYWSDERMKGAERYDNRFYSVLDERHCKGIIYFLCDPFFLSEPCANEMKYFLEKYGTEHPDKFCLFVVPEGFPYGDDEAIYGRVLKYAMEKGDGNLQKNLRFANDYIKLFSQLSANGKVLCAVRGNRLGYIDSYCAEEGLFHSAGIVFGRKQTENDTFGYFPQKKLRQVGANDIEQEKELRPLDYQPAYYYPVEWLVLKDNEQSQTLLSRDLLFAVDYLELKYPYAAGSKSVEQYIKDYFLRYFRQDERGRKIKEIRLLSETELDVLIRRNQKDSDKKAKVLLPDATFFAQISQRKTSHPFWLAGDIADARRVDSGIEGLSAQPIGTEMYYIRIVLEIEKQEAQKQEE